MPIQVESGYGCDLTVVASVQTFLVEFRNGGRFDGNEFVSISLKMRLDFNPTEMHLDKIERSDICFQKSLRSVK